MARNAAKNWERICLNKKANTIVLSSYNNKQENCWANLTKHCFSSIRLLDVFLNHRPGKAPNIQLFCREKDIFQQTSISGIQSTSKLCTYVALKDNITFEEYLISVKNISNRIALTRFRLSNHTLMIEKGRHNNTNQTDRICPFCPKRIENEFHFLIKCPIYTNLRLSLHDEIAKITTGFYPLDNDNSLFRSLLSNPRITHLTARFIKLAMDLRAFLLEGPRNTN